MALCLVGKAGRGRIWEGFSSVMSQKAPIPLAPCSEAAQPNHGNPSVESFGIFQEVRFIRSKSDARNWFGQIQKATFHPTYNTRGPFLEGGGGVNCPCHGEICKKSLFCQCHFLPFWISVVHHVWGHSLFIYQDNIEDEDETKAFVRSCMFWNKPVTKEPITLCNVT